MSKRVVKPKEGYKTSEFVLAVGTIAGIVFGMPVPPEIAGWMITGVVGVYTIARTWLKRL